MKRTWILIALLAVVLSACGTAPSATKAPDKGGSKTGYPAPTKAVAPTSYPAAGGKAAATSAPANATAYPGAKIALPAIQSGQPTSAPAQAQPKDLSRSPVFIDKAEVVADKSTPAKYKLTVSGNKPPPCHEVQFAAGTPDKDNKIVVDIYTTVKSGQVCAQVLSPFTLDVDLSTLAAGKYKVFANDKAAGEITVK